MIFVFYYIYILCFRIIPVTQKKVTPWKDKCIQNLKPQTYYKFYIRAFNSKGAGAKSDTVTVKTLESCMNGIE